MSTWKIELHNVEFAHHRKAPRLFWSVSLELTLGRRLAIVGPSGSGKTTLLRIIAGLSSPSAGSVVRSRPAPRIGMLAQDDVFLPWRSVWGNLNLVREKDTTPDELEAMLTSVGLPRAAFGDRLPSELSGGERRRLGLAMVLASKPDLVLLDEAGSSLDESTRFRIVDEIISALDRACMASVIITHDLEEALLLGDQILVFDGAGRVAVKPVPLARHRRSQSRFSPEFQAMRASLMNVREL